MYKSTVNRAYGGGPQGNSRTDRRAPVVRAVQRCAQRVYEAGINATVDTTQNHYLELSAPGSQFYFALLNPAPEHTVSHMVCFDEQPAFLFWSPNGISLADRFVSGRRTFPLKWF